MIGHPAPPETPVSHESVGRSPGRFSSDRPRGGCPGTPRGLSKHVRIVLPESTVSMAKCISSPASSFHPRMRRGGSRRARGHVSRVIWLVLSSALG
ncbi:hypothetical protein NL676_020081 [Syzygium grande]|nr:hypothetical protein NL676_020081 [Syzygium grande]